MQEPPSTHNEHKQILSFSTSNKKFLSPVYIPLGEMR